MVRVSKQTMTAKRVTSRHGEWYVYECPTGSLWTWKARPISSSYPEQFELRWARVDGFKKWQNPKSTNYRSSAAFLIGDKI